MYSYRRFLPTLALAVFAVVFCSHLQAGNKTPKTKVSKACRTKVCDRPLFGGKSACGAMACCPDDYCRKCPPRICLPAYCGTCDCYDRKCAPCICLPAYCGTCDCYDPKCPPCLSIPCPSSAYYKCPLPQSCSSLQWKLRKGK